MEHLFGLATEVYDSVTGTDGDTVADHFAETGQQWIELADAVGIDIQSNQWEPATVARSLHMGMNIFRNAKRIQYRMGHINPFIVTVETFVVFGIGVLTAAGHFAQGSVIASIGGGADKKLQVMIADGTGDNDIVEFATLTFDAQANPYTLVAEKLGTIIKIYLAEEPGTALEYDLADNSFIADTENNGFIGVQDVTADANTQLTLSGVSVEY